MKTPRTVLAVALLWAVNLLAPVLHWAVEAVAHHEDHEPVVECADCEAHPAGPTLDGACGEGPCDDPHHHHHGTPGHQHSTLCSVCSSLFARLAPVDVEFVLPELHGTVLVRTDENPSPPCVQVAISSARGPPPGMEHAA